MGKEQTCTIRVNGVARRSKAHLDSTSLRLSGLHRLTLPLADVAEVHVTEESLHLASAAGRIELELGRGIAEKWAHAITQPKSRLQKLSIRADDRVCIRDLRDREFLAEIAAAVKTAPATALRGAFDAIFQGLDDPQGLTRLAQAKEHLVPAGALWLVHPKGKGSPVGEGAVRAAILAAGLYEAKVVAFSATHTATKAAIPLAARPMPASRRTAVRS